MNIDRRGFLFGGAVAALAAAAESCNAVGPSPRDGRKRATWHERLATKGPLFIAHRGCQSLAPENTIPSFTCAARLGLQAIETDVRFSADGLLVCSHDDSLKRMFGLKQKVSATPYAERGRRSSCASRRSGSTSTSASGTTRCRSSRRRATWPW